MTFQLQNVHKARIALVIFIVVVGFLFYWRLGTDETPGDRYVKTGNYRLEDGLYEQAEQEFKKALAEAPDNVSGHLGLGITYIQMEHYDEALSELNRAIELDPDNSVAWADRGILYDKTGFYEKALANYKKALALDAEAVEGPGFLWRFMRNISEKPPEIKDRVAYLEKELEKPAEKRLLRLEAEDKKQRMHK